MQDFSNFYHGFLHVSRIYLEVCSIRNFILLDSKFLIMLLFYNSRNGSENSYGKMQEMVNISILCCKRLKNNNTLVLAASFINYNRCLIASGTPDV